MFHYLFRTFTKIAWLQEGYNLFSMKICSIYINQQLFLVFLLIEQAQEFNSLRSSDAFMHE